MVKHVCAVALFALLLLLVARIEATPATRPHANLAPTYRIFATREGLVGLTTANGHVIRERDHFVALPSWRVLSSYQGYEYQVRITYNGRSTIAPVWDVGPWNTNDSYWSPQRGDYPDLPIGMPQAQAAYFDGHNDGLDEFGRRILVPNGIDIADGTFWDALGMRDNDWVEVSFLWLGTDPGPGAAVQAPIPPPPVPAPQPSGPEPVAPAPQPGEPAPQQPAPQQPAPPPATPTPADNTPPSSRITAITRDGRGYAVEWAGSDDLSGIASYDVEVRQLPNGMWRLWVSASSDSGKWFGPDEGHHFAFRVRARDNAGNEEAWSEAGAMDTTQAAPEPQTP
jgi:hypothetical protein